MFKPTLSREEVKEELSKLQPLNYNQFRWWRRYDSLNKPLDKRQPLRDRILNGDFDYSHYKYQVMEVEYELNDIWEECKPDAVKFNEKGGAIGRARRKRLLEDAEKDEFERLQELKKSFTRHYRIDMKQIEEEMISFLGDSLLDFYYYIDDKYKIIHAPYPLKRRGRPRKHESITRST